MRDIDALAEINTKNYNNKIKDFVKNTFTKVKNWLFS